MDNKKIEQVLLLGTFRLKTNKNCISIQGKKNMALLACILSEPSKRIKRINAETLLWSQRSQEQSKASLRQCLSDLRKQLAPLENFALNSDRNEISLHLDSISLDIENLSYGIKSKDLDSIIWAACMYKGPFLGELCIADPVFEEWIYVQRLKFQNIYISLLKNILNRLNIDENVELIKIYAEKLLEVDNCSEIAHGSLMKCFNAEGNQSKALKQFTICCSYLDKELSVNPSQELVAIYNKIRISGQNLRPSTKSPKIIPKKSENSFGLTVAVFPFKETSISTEDKGLGIGIARDIRMGLSKFNWISVASKYSTMNVTISVYGLRKICRDLNVRYIIDGSIRHLKTCNMLNIELLDGLESTIIWAESFPLKINNQHNLNKTLSKIICQLDVHLRTQEIRRVSNLQPDELNAYDCVIRAVSTIQLMTPESLYYADKLFTRALALSPGYAAVYTWKIYWEIFCIGQGLAKDHQQEMIRANQIAREALIRDPDDSIALAMQGHFQSFLEHNFVFAKELHRKAYELNPNSSMVLLLNSFTYCYCGNPQKALDRLYDLEGMTHIEPQHQFFYYLAKSVAHTFARDYDAGIIWGLICISKAPNFINGYKPLICCLGHLDRKYQARSLIERLLKLEPTFCIKDMNRVYPFEKEIDRVHYMEGMAKAGVPYDRNLK